MFTDDLILYIGYPKNTTKKKVLMNSAKLQDTQFMYKNHVAFLYTKSELSEREIKKTISFKIASINMKSDQISRSVVSDSLRPHESQHARPPCPSPTPGVHSDSRPSSQ